MRQIALDLVQHRVDRRGDPDAHAALDPVADDPQIGGEALPSQAEPGVQDGSLEGRFRHAMAADPGQTATDVLGFEDRSLGQQRGDEVLGERDPSPVQPLLRVPRFGRRDALTPAHRVVSDDRHEDGALLPLLPEARAERPHQRKGDLEEFHRTDQERRLVHVSSREGSNTYLPSGRI
jgi:hypothetical protein